MSHWLKFSFSCTVHTQKGNSVIPLKEQIVCQQISEPNKESVLVDNVDPLFDLFLTEKFDPSLESISEIELLSEIDHAKNASSA